MMKRWRRKKQQICEGPQVLPGLESIKNRLASVSMRPDQRGEQVVAEQKSTNVTWHENHVSREEREKITGQRGCTIWLTGLSGAGKSTVAVAVERLLADRGRLVYLLDGDNIRHGMNANLGFSPEDRTENIRRIGEVAKLFTDAGLICLTAFVSPYRADRDKVRELLAPGDFVEVYVEASLETCEARDTKGLYAKARAGEIPEFTGISAPYEAPEKAELVLDTNGKTIEESARELVEYLEEHGILPK